MNSKILTSLSLVGLMSLNACKTDIASSTAELKTPEDSVSYMLGLNIGRNIKQGGVVDNVNAELFAKGVSDVFLGKDSSVVKPEKVDEYLQNYFTRASQEKAKAALGEGKKYLDNNAKNPGITTTASGLQYKVMAQGTGIKPTAEDTVSVHYKGTLIDGTKFDSSYDRNAPVSFPVGGVIPGWTEALQLMSEGSKYMLYVPANLAYGENSPSPQIKPNSVLLFEVELLKVIPKK